MKMIPLSRGLSAKVDDADFDFLSQWKWSASRQGRAGCAEPKFRAVRVEGTRGAQRMVLMHRQIMAPNVGEVIDHINGNPLDNQRENLRICTHSQNALNRGANHTRRSSNYKGVALHRCGKWMAQFRKQYLGLFDSEVDAAIAYDHAAVKSGELVPLNLAGGPLN